MGRYLLEGLFLWNQDGFKMVSNFFIWNHPWLWVVSRDFGGFFFFLHKYQYHKMTQFWPNITICWVSKYLSFVKQITKVKLQRKICYYLCRIIKSNQNDLAYLRTVKLTKIGNYCMEKYPLCGRILVKWWNQEKYGDPIKK